MADTQRDFWPDIAVEEPVTTPLSILKEQAAVLARKTNGLLEGRVENSTRGREFRYVFKIVAPTLDNYSYELFRVRHGVLLYPAWIQGPQLQDTELKSEQEFVDALKQVLSSDETMRVISALLAQVKA